MENIKKYKSLKGLHIALTRVIPIDYRVENYFWFSSKLSSKQIDRLIKGVLSNVTDYIIINKTNKFGYTATVIKVKEL